VEWQVPVLESKILAAVSFLHLVQILESFEQVAQLVSLQASMEPV
jgi:hypothetical protein